MRCIRVIHLVEDLKIGGLERVLATLVTHLDKHRYFPEVWCLAAGGRIARELRKNGISVRILGCTSYHRPLHILRLARLLQRAKADILHTHGYFASTFGRLVSFLTGPAIRIQHVHTTDHGLTARHRQIERMLARITHTVVCISEAVRRFVVDREGIPVSKTRVIYNGVKLPGPADPKQASPLLLDWSADTFVVTTIGSLTPHKGHHILIRAVEILSERHPEIRLVIVGDGPLRWKLSEQVGRANLQEKVWFAGELESVFPVLYQTDLFVLPSMDREGLSIAAIEATAAGRAIVASNLGGIPEVVQDGLNGLLVPPGDPNRLAEAMEALIRDPDRRQKMGTAGRHRFNQCFQARQMTAEIERLYDETMKRPAN